MVPQSYFLTKTLALTHESPFRPYVLGHLKAFLASHPDEALQAEVLTSLLGILKIAHQRFPNEADVLLAHDLIAVAKGTPRTAESVDIACRALQRLVRDPAFPIFDEVRAVVFMAMANAQGVACPPPPRFLTVSWRSGCCSRRISRGSRTSSTRSSPASS
jgi:hypothetical protein